MKFERCDRCKTEQEIDEKTSDWTDVEYKGRQSTITHIRKASYCPRCTKDLKSKMYEFNQNNPINNTSTIINNVVEK